VNERRNLVPRFRALSAGAIAGLLMATAFIGPATANQTITDTPLPLTGFAAITVDAGSGNVYISSATDGAVVAVDPAGTVLGTITGIGWVRGLAIAGQTLYAALPRQDAIAAIDLASFTVRDLHSTGPQTCPTHLASTGEVVWFGHGCGSSFDGGLGSLRMVDGSPVVTLREQGPTTIIDPPLVAALPRPEGPVVIGAPTSSPTSVQVFDIVGGRAVPRVTSGHNTLGSDAYQVDLTPDGSQVLVAAGSPYEFAQSVSAARLRWVGTYDTGANPIAVVASPDGSRVAAGIGDPNGDNVFVYQRGQSTPRVNHRLGAYLTRRGLAWSPDSSRLYAVAGTYSPTSVTLRVLTVRP
jgi:hypothetical protein